MPTVWWPPLAQDSWGSLRNLEGIGIIRSYPRYTRPALSGAFHPDGNYCYPSLFVCSPHNYGQVNYGEIAPAFISKSFQRKLLKREKLMAQFIKY
jgi:hypothetical protein